MKKSLLLLCLLHCVSLHATTTYRYPYRTNENFYPRMMRYYNEYPYSENSTATPVDTKEYTGKGVTVGVMDSDFDSSSFYNSLKYRYLSPERFQNYNDIANRYHVRGSGSDHGFNVARIIAGNEKGVAKEASIIGTSFGVGQTRISSDPSKYRHLFAVRPDIKIYNQSFGQTMDITQYKDYIFGINNIYERNIDNDYQFKNLLDRSFSHYKEGVEKDILFIWAAGNMKQNGNYYSFFENPSVEAGLPYYMPELEKGWISVVGLNFTRNAPREYTSGILGGHLARAGVAARWTISADAIFNNGKVEMVGSSFAAPRVAGVAALIKEKYPWMGANEIRQAILTTAQRPQMYETSKNDNPHYYNSHKEFVIKPIHLTMEEGTRRMGWGILDEKRAINGPAMFTKELVDLTDPTGHRFQANIPSVKMHSIFSNDISGDGGLHKRGLGKLSLTGNNSYVGDTLISEGRLAIHKQSHSPIRIQSEGTLQVYPETELHTKENTTTVINEGTLQNFGTGATIFGDYVGTKNSKLLADIRSNLKVTGRAILSEESEIIPHTSEYISRTPVSNTILNVTEGISVKPSPLNDNRRNSSTRLGRFSSQYRSSSLLNSILSMNENSVTLSMSRTPVTEVMASTGESTQNVAQNLEAVFVAADNGNVGTETLASLVHLQAIDNHENLTRSLNTLSGEVYASAQALTFQQSQTVNRNLSNRLSSMKHMEENYKSNAWMSYFASHGKLRETGYDSAKTILHGGQFGIDHLFHNDYILGAAIDYSYSTANFKTYAGNSKSSSVGFSLYGRKNLGYNFYTQARIGVSTVSSRVKREVLQKSSDIHHRDSVYSSYLELGKNFHIDQIQISPFIGYSYDILERGKFEETVDSLAIQAVKKRYHRSGVLMGIRGDYNVIQKDGKKTNLNTYASIEKNIKTSSLAFDAKYHGDSKESATFKGIELPKYTIWAGLGVEQDLNEQSSVYVNYDMKIEKDKVADQMATVGFKYKF